MSESSSQNIFSTKTTLRGVVFRLLVSTVLLASATFGAVVLSRSSAPVQREGVEAAIPAVQVETVREQENGLTFKIDGVVVPFREVPIASEVSGRITFLSSNCRVGRYVEKGEVIIRVDPTDYELVLAQSQQELIQAKRQVVELEVNIRNTRTQLEIAQKQLHVQRRELERVQALSKDGAISQSDLDSTMLTELQKLDSVQTLENQAVLQESQKERLVASMKLAEVTVEKARVDLDRCTIKAPLDGVVVSLSCEQDKFVQRGESLVTIHDTSKLEVQCSLYMKHVEWLWAARSDTKEAKTHAADPRNYYQFDPTPVTIVYELGHAEYHWKGMLEYLDGPGLDSRTRMLPCRVVVDNPLDVTRVKAERVAMDANPSLLPGMFVGVRVHVVPRSRLLNISEMAILPGGTLWKVVDGKMHRVNITTAQTEDERVLVYADPGKIDVGDQVIVSPLASPLEGASVEVVR
ncbi:MAG: efflux RND transporter periplasmic adaptor subunit [Planctomycetia bacterium]|nr:efflux RND transporter periplasmic adaptor subunit [Planctomycetia bacterium]